MNSRILATMQQSNGKKKGEYAPATVWRLFGNTCYANASCSTSFWIHGLWQPCNLTKRRHRSLAIAFGKQSNLMLLRVFELTDLGNHAIWIWKRFVQSKRLAKSVLVSIELATQWFYSKLLWKWSVCIWKSTQILWIRSILTISAPLFLLLPERVYCHRVELDHKTLLQFMHPDTSTS